MTPIPAEARTYALMDAIAARMAALLAQARSEPEAAALSAYADAMDAVLAAATRAASE